MSDLENNNQKESYRKPKEDREELEQTLKECNKPENVKEAKRKAKKLTSFSAEKLLKQVR